MARKTIAFTERQEEMIKELQEKRGFPTFTSAVHYCVAETHEKNFKDYAQRAKMSPEEKAESDVKKDEAKLNREIEKQKKIAETLGGKVFAEGGALYCEYFTYSKTSRYTQKMPLLNLTEELIANQYFPSKEVVEEYQKQGKTDYTNAE